METLVELQRWIYGAVSDRLMAFEGTRDFALLLGMVPLGIVLGALHALTPGHGKMILASYAAGSEVGVARSLVTAATLSATHVASAVVLALVGTSLLSRTLAGAGQSRLIEQVSGGLIALVGVWLVVRAMRRGPHLHGEGAMVGVAAGLVPCPLTLFAVMYAVARGVPEAGVAFALAMLVGITLTLGAVAMISAVARARVLATTGPHIVLARLRLGADTLAGLLLVGFGLSRAL